MAVASTEDRELRGAKSYYRLKSEQVTVYLSPVGKRALDAATKRTGKSRADVVEHLVRQYAADVTFVGDEEG